MGIFGEWVLNKLKQRVYAVTHAKVVVRNKSTVDKDLTDLENRATSLEDNMATVKQSVANINKNMQSGIIADGTAVIMLGTANATGEVTIPTTGWTKATTDTEYHLDIENSAITESIVPVVAVSPDHYDTAVDCGLKPYCRTLDGILRLYAEKSPSKPIVASIALIGEKSSTIEADDLPLATRTTAGAVKPGNGFTLDANTGELSIDTNVVMTNDDLVDETNALDSIRSALQS